MSEYARGLRDAAEVLLRMAEEAEARPAGGAYPRVRDDLAEVASVYREALERGERGPTTTVAEALGLTIDQAAKRVAACRRVGLLPRTSSGRARA